MYLVQRACVQAIPDRPTGAGRVASDMTTTPSAPQTGAVRAPRRRVPLWDNARFACIVLVVLGRLDYSTWSAIAGSTIWCKFFASFGLSWQAHAKLGKPGR